jgi:Zn-dependent M16 (insulinase) family peptidase
MLGYRFPIGLEEQIKKWDPETIKAFHERWYFPANATLFIVGDIGSVSRTLEMIEVCKVCCSESNASCRKSSR